MTLVIPVFYRNHFCFIKVNNSLQLTWSTNLIYLISWCNCFHEASPPWELPACRRSPCVLWNPPPHTPQKNKHGNHCVIFRTIFKGEKTHLTHQKLRYIRNSSKIQVPFSILIKDLNMYFTETHPYIICQARIRTCRLQEHSESHELSLEITANHR